MIENESTPRSLDELCQLDIAAAFYNELKSEGQAPSDDPATREIIRAIFFATDVVRQAILSAHDKYNP